MSQSFFDIAASLQQSQNKSYQLTMDIIAKVQKELNGDVNAINDFIELELRSFEKRLNLIVQDYCQRREQLLQDALSKVEQINQWPARPDSANGKQATENQTISAN